MESCLSCRFCLPIGDGDHICSKYNTPLLVLDEYEPTENFLFCQQNKEIE